MLDAMRCRRLLSIAAVTGLLVAVGCTTRRSAVQYPPPGPGPGGAPAPGQPPPPGGPAPGAAGPGATPQSPAPSAVLDPVNNVDIGWLRNRTQQLLTDLLQALDPGPRQRVGNIPLVVDDTVGEVNAFAACSNGKAAMAVTDGLLEISAHLAQAKATDELFGSQKTSAYIQLVATQQRPGQPIVRPPLGFFVTEQHLDPRKVARQHQILDELLAFILGHELAHHYLGHLPCTAPGGALSPAEINLVLASAVPMFNQPNEVAADMAGTNSVLNAGRRRSDYAFTEAGGLLTMDFFSGLDQMSPIDILFSFESSHPAPQLRRPIIQQTANAWRMAGGRSLPIP